MIFINKIGSEGEYTAFNFYPHDKSLANVGDQIWSNGSRVEILGDCDIDVLHYFIGQIENKREFYSALIECGILS